MSTEVEVAVIPPCDICPLEVPGSVPAPAVYDGKTIHGPWANMCEKHWQRYGVGQLGTGFGQRLILRESE
jgi:hypothetical protein